MEGQGLDSGIEYKIDLNKMKGNIVYLGRKPINDPAINYIEIPDCETAIGIKHMEIEYRNESRSYFVKDNESENGTFLKIDRSLKLVPGYIFAFGESRKAII